MEAAVESIDNTKVVILWDTNTLPLPSDYKITLLKNEIANCLSLSGYTGEIEIKSFGNPEKLHPQHKAYLIHKANGFDFNNLWNEATKMKAIRASGVKIGKNVAICKKNTPDVIIANQCLKLVVKNKNEKNHIFLASNDSEFIKVGKALNKIGYVVLNSHHDTNKNLKWETVASKIWLWHELINCNVEKSQVNDKVELPKGSTEWNNKEDGEEVTQQWKDDDDDVNVNDDFSLQLNRQLENNSEKK